MGNKKQRRQTQSLSARERKELRNREKERETSADGRITAEREELARRRRILAIVILVFAVIAVTAAASVPIFMSCNYMFERNPVAVIKLDAGDRTLTMKYELLDSDAPIACANFAFLASIGWFDGAVVYDTQNDYVRFGGYRSSMNDSGGAAYTHLADDESFTSAQTANFAENRYSTTDHSGMFSYSLKSDNSNFTYTDSRFEFALCSQTSASRQASTEFQISGSTKQRQDSLGGKTVSVIPFARPLNADEATKEAVTYILGLERGETKINGSFLAPASTVTVKSVKVYNYSEEWTSVKYEHGFETYMTDELKGFYSTTWSRKHI